MCIIHVGCNFRMVDFRLVNCPRKSNSLKHTIKRRDNSQTTTLLKCAGHIDSMTLVSNKLPEISSVALCKSTPECAYMDNTHMAK
jgi:hypothetical protein